MHKSKVTDIYVPATEIKQILASFGLFALKMFERYKAL